MPESYSGWAIRWRVPLGFGAGIAYLVFAQPTIPLLVAGGSAAALGLALRGFAAGYLDKNHRLATGGPYAYTRNPLYLGSCLMGIGFVLAGGSWPMALVLVGLFLLVYWPVIRREEDFLRHEFGDAYDGYARRVPLLLPTRGRAVPSPAGFSWRQYRVNREYEAFAGFVGALLFLAAKLMLR